MKKLNIIAASLVLASSGAFAATATDSFDVTINFTAQCTVKTAANDMTFAYSAFRTGAALTGTATTVFECTRGLTPTFSLNDNGSDMTSNGTQALATALSGEGVIKGIRYTLAGSSSRTQTGDAATAGTGGTGGSNGTADEYTVSFTANIANGQAGDGATGGGTHTRVLTITY